jgi:ribosome-associated protein
LTAARSTLFEQLGLPADAAQESYVRASGPGGQNVNKVATAVRLRLDLKRCDRLPSEVLERLRRLAGRRLSGEDVVVITAQRYRTQDRNRTDAWARVDALLAAALVAAKVRKPTRPTRASRERRLREKSQRSGRKRSRAGVQDYDAD